MKLYTHIPEYIIRLEITRQGEERQYINLCDTTPGEVNRMIKSILEKQSISVFDKSKKTAIQIRESIDGKLKPGLRISFRGISTKDIFDLIIKKIETKNKGLKITHHENNSQQCRDRIDR